MTPLPLNRAVDLPTASCPAARGLTRAPGTADRRATPRGRPSCAASRRRPRRPELLPPTAVYSFSFVSTTPPWRERRSRSLRTSGPPDEHICTLTFGRYLGVRLLAAFRASRARSCSARARSSAESEDGASLNASRSCALLRVPRRTTRCSPRKVTQIVPPVRNHPRAYTDPSSVPSAHGSRAAAPRANAPGGP
jgi:hypothetical protein